MNASRITGAILALELTRVAALAGDLPEPRLLRVPGGGVQPRAAVDANGDIHLVYLQGDPAACDVFYARKPKGAPEFATARRVNSEPGTAVALGTVRGAQLALGRNGLVHVVWNGSSRANPAQSPLWYARQNEERTGFERQRDLRGDTTHLDGGAAVAADPSGNVYVVWHAHEPGAPPGEVGRGVLVARSADDGRTFEKERRLSPQDLGACGCCGLQAFAVAGGELAVLYRSATAAGSRDATLLLDDLKKGTVRSKALGPWKVSMCPMSTMALDAGPANTLFAMWETRGQIYYSGLTPARLPETVSAQTADGTGTNRKHPAFAFSPGGERLLLAWTEGTGWQKGGAVAWECIDLKSGERKRGRADGLPVWDCVAAVADADGSFLIIY